MKGDNGQTCDQVCQPLGKVCNSDMQSTLTTDELVDNAFWVAGYHCKGFHKESQAHGAPFSTGWDGNDCAPIIAGITSSCTKNKNETHAPLCYCNAGNGH